MVPVCLIARPAPGRAREVRPMAEILNRSIKDVIAEHPGVGDVLNEFGIACTACTVGTCALKDIVLYHEVPEARKAEMWARIGRAAGNGALTPPAAAAHTVKPVSATGFSPPLQRLVDEHVLIKRLLARIPDLIAAMDLETPEGRNHVFAAVDFIRNFADRYHHAKEEDILFKFFDETRDIIRVMHADHRAARAHVMAICEAVERRDAAAAARNLGAYRELLSEHIRKEDDVLYPWMDRELGDREVGELFQAFHRVDAEAFDPGHADNYAHYIERLEQQCSRGKEDRK